MIRMERVEQKSDASKWQEKAYMDDAFILKWDNFRVYFGDDEAVSKQLMKVHGVTKVVVGSYSVWIRVAGHVTTIFDAATGCRHKLEQFAKKIRKKKKKKK
jgi:hypothetical protein